ncbi:hypothetical protein NKI54_34840 [Mesorhizobium sp. M0663]
MHARIDSSDIRLLTRTGLDWSHRYQATIAALRPLPVKEAYVDGELCAVRADGVTSFSRLQAAMDEGRTGDLAFFAFDLLFLNGESIANLPLIDRKARPEGLFSTDMPGLRFSDHVIGDGPAFRKHACRLALEYVDTPIAETSQRMPQLTTSLLQKYGEAWTHSLAINDLYFDFMGPSLAAAGKAGTDAPINVAAGDGIGLSAHSRRPVPEGLDGMIKKASHDNRRSTSKTGHQRHLRRVHPSIFDQFEGGILSDKRALRTSGHRLPWVLSS